MKKNFISSKKLELLAGLLSEDAEIEHDAINEVNQTKQEEIVEMFQGLDKEFDKQLNELYPRLGFRPDEEDGQEVEDCADPESAFPDPPEHETYPVENSRWWYWEADETYQKIQTMKDDMQVFKGWKPPLDVAIVKKENKEINSLRLKNRIDKLLTESSKFRSKKLIKESGDDNANNKAVAEFVNSHEDIKEALKNVGIDLNDDSDMFDTLDGLSVFAHDYGEYALVDSLRKLGYKPGLLLNHARLQDRALDVYNALEKSYGYSKVEENDYEHYEDQDPREKMKKRKDGFRD